MSDAVAAARARIDRALTALERKINDLKARPATARPIEDDDLFAIPSTTGSDPALRQRIAVLEAAGHDASDALAGAIDQLRDLIEVGAPEAPAGLADEEEDD
jgi:hypothetical protein